MSDVTEDPDLEEYNFAAFQHAEAHSKAGSDFALCDNNDCPYWPDGWERAGRKRDALVSEHPACQDQRAVVAWGEQRK